jgi:hypothetical protein
MNKGTGLAVYSSKEYKELRVALMDDECDDYNLKQRKHLLDDAFVYNKDNADLMCELSDCLCRAITDLHKKCLKVYKAIQGSGVSGKITVTGNIMPTFPHSHPRFSDEEEIVNSLCDGTYNPSINLMRGIFIQGEEEDCEESVLGMEELYCSTAEWLCNQQVPRLLNHWLSHTNYALYDLLYVREYTFEIDVDIDGIRL